MVSTKQHMSLFVKDIFDRYAMLTEDCQVTIVGVVVDISCPDPELHPNRPLVVRLDDGTGVIKCAMFRHHTLNHLKDIKMGDCFQARGTVNRYFEELQIKCVALKTVIDPNFETLWMNKVISERKLKEWLKD